MMTRERRRWFVAKAAVALFPVVTFGAADVIRWFLRRHHLAADDDGASSEP